MNGRTIFVDRTASTVIDDLRMQEYAKATGFDLDLSTLMWRESDDESYVMAAEENGFLIATMRGEVIAERTMLERKLECAWDFPMDLTYPVLLLSRAATASTHRSLGLNLVLRFYFLQLALHHGLGAVVGTFVSRSPRENTLREMGYKFFENKHGWQQSTYRSHRQVHVVALDLSENSEMALEYCRKKVPESIETYSFSGPYPDLKFVRSV